MITEAEAIRGLPMQAAALAYAERGWPVLPLNPGEKVPLRLPLGRWVRAPVRRTRARAREESATGTPTDPE